MGGGRVPQFIPTLDKRLARLANPPHMRAANDSAGTRAAFVVSEDVPKLDAFQAGDCNAIIVDHTRNRSRSWCSGEGYDNRERVRSGYCA